VKRCGKSAPPFQQWSGQGKPHTEQDQIGRKPGSERKLRLDACRLGAPNLRVGRLSRAVMRGPEEWPSCWSNPADRIRLTGPAAFIKTVVGRVIGRWQDRSSAKIAESVEKNVWDFIPGPGTRVWPSTKDQRPTTNDAPNSKFELEKTMSAPSRRPEIRRRRTRKEKIVKLLKRHAAAGSETDRSRLAAKLSRLARTSPGQPLVKS
jgi:hypothetical protein